MTNSAASDFCGNSPKADSCPTASIKWVSTSIVPAVPKSCAKSWTVTFKPRGLTAGFGGMIALVDGMIHQQDIRRVLGIRRTVPAERLQAVLDYARYAPAVRGTWRARGVRLVATDVDWSHGSGQEVRGPGEALLMAMAGRPRALADLTGPGKPKLARNIHA